MPTRTPTKGGHSRQPSLGGPMDTDDSAPGDAA